MISRQRKKSASTAARSCDSKQQGLGKQRQKPSDPGTAPEAATEQPQWTSFLLLLPPKAASLKIHALVCVLCFPHLLLPRCYHGREVCFHFHAIFQVFLHATESIWPLPANKYATFRKEIANTINVTNQQSLILISNPFV
jgi:hypothetical protein